MRTPILTLTTDFGLSDHYVGVMKGVILGICPRAQLVDISHEGTAFAIAEAAYTIAQAYRYFPRKTVHVVVVDPGVGSARCPILMEAAGQYFVAPDNGVLGMVAQQEKHKVRLISNARYFLRPVSRTFHGRDIFAPVAAHLAAGVSPSKIGKSLDDYLRPDFVTPARLDPRTWRGRILKIDRFGNLITNFPAKDFPSLQRKPFVLRIAGREISVLASTYAGQKPGELFVIAGSSGYLEISVNQGSAAQVLDCSNDASVDLAIS